MAGEFGTVFMPQMAAATWGASATGEPAAWSEPELVPADRLVLHPGAHVLHYASTCFEGMKAFRHDDGRIALFRPERNIARFARSSELLCLPPIDPAHTRALIEKVLVRFRDEVPAPPASMYIRPTHVGTEAAIGKAAAPTATSLQYVLLSPVGDYFAGGERALRVLIETHGERCGRDHGAAKGGGNYASALKHVVRAHRDAGCDQVLFCPDGDVTETGAANFVLIEGGELVTRRLDDSFLHGITRDSVLRLAEDAGLAVVERELRVDEVLERAARPGAEAGLTGTAAVIAAVGTLVVGPDSGRAADAREVRVGDGRPGPVLRQLRERLNAIQWGRADDVHGWLEFV